MSSSSAATAWPSKPSVSGSLTFSPFTSSKPETRVDAMRTAPPESASSSSSTSIENQSTERSSRRHTHRYHTPSLSRSAAAVGRRIVGPGASSVSSANTARCRMRTSPRQEAALMLALIGGLQERECGRRGLQAASPSLDGTKWPSDAFPVLLAVGSFSQAVIFTKEGVVAVAVYDSIINPSNLLHPQPCDRVVSNAFW